MHRPAVPDAYIEEVAERTDFAVDDVRIGLRVLHDAVQDRIVEQYRRARDADSPNHLLIDDADSAWFAFAFADLRAELEAAGYEMDDDLLAAVAAVNMTVFQEVHDRTVSFPRDLADASDTPFFYPVYVGKPDWWREAETRALRSLVGLLESGSSPAAALDAWAVTLAGVDAEEWARIRGVSAERVRTNAGNAPDPAPEAADGLRAEARGEVPDGPYDPETDRLFVPTTDQLAAAREADADAESEAESEPGAEVDADADTDSRTASDPDGLAEIDPDEVLAGDVDAADLPEYAVQGDDGLGEGSASDAPASDAPVSDAAGDDAGGSAGDDDRLVDGAAAFERDEGSETEDGVDRGVDEEHADGAGGTDEHGGDDERRREGGRDA
ncbi:hypothetical protein Hbl1158_14430 [Halobaculum sp. CBA1158]|uniref:hypothetical protein n=1 Tax=Halobaculum sp. CBA1158 TaxID=2904243 RepID=UPI001F2109F9|nr:hypothetical protein [Halobaculum sp. CBA1158]UIO99702.1 hypothetical protein Hbl1158_14430 [Halobaculum sp. CBA1158]